MTNSALLNAQELKVNRGGQTRDRETAYRSAINTWLKADPQNLVICKNIIEQNKERRKGMRNDFGSTRMHGKDLRIGLSLPHGLYYTLMGLERLHDRKFMATKEDLRWFAKTFPQFCVVSRI
jgi:hypothetical protein